MKLCLLYLSVLTLLQLHSRFVASGAQIILLPSIEKLNAGLGKRPPKVNITNRISVGDDSAVRASSNIIINLAESVSLSDSGDVNTKPEILQLAYDVPLIGTLLPIPQGRSVNVNVEKQAIENASVSQIQKRTLLFGKRDPRPISIAIGSNNVNNKIGADNSQPPPNNVVTINNSNTQDDKGSGKPRPSLLSRALDRLG